MEELELAVLSLLIFPETFASIVDECPTPTSKHIVGDVLKKLIHDELVVPLLENEKGNFQRSLGYDSDGLYHYRYQITAKGQSVLEHLSIK